jgi:transposase
VGEYRTRAEASGLDWEQVEKLRNSELEYRIFGDADKSAGRPVPEWNEIHQERKKKGVTLQLLWEEYKAANPTGYQYSHFCELYSNWRGRLKLSMRQVHTAGEKLFVDYSGQKVPIHDPSTGEIHEAEIFVAVLGASNYTYAEATLSQQLPDWIGSHVRSFEFFGGVPSMIVPDNLKSGVTKPCWYEPDLNPTYQDLVSHYNTAVMPARVRKPKDKAKVEGGVLIIQRWILACLRHHKFFSLAEVNAAIRPLLDRANNRPFKKLPGTRRSQFEILDRPALKALPETRFEYAEWQKVRVRRDYHVEVKSHYYSVPYQLAGKELDIRVTAQTVECFHGGERAACHALSHEVGGCTTLQEHMPKNHRSYAESTPQELVQWAEETGENTREVIERILISRAHPQQGFRSCQGIRRLGKEYGVDRLEAACHRALMINGLSFKSISSILKNNLDRQKVPRKLQIKKIDHSNIRGAKYYHSTEFEQEVIPC